MFCDYYEKEINEADFDEALEHYHSWMENNKQKPEVDRNAELDDVSESELVHVLYHAELNGFEV